MLVKLCRKDVLTTAVGFAKALLKLNLAIFPANKCIRPRKTFLNHRRGRAALELC